MGQLCLLAEIPSLHEADGINLIFPPYELMHANLEVPIKKICLQSPVQLQAFAHTIGIVLGVIKKEHDKNAAVCCSCVRL